MLIAEIKINRYHIYKIEVVNMGECMNKDVCKYRYTYYENGKRKGTGKTSHFTDEGALILLMKVIQDIEGIER